MKGIPNAERQRLGALLDHETQETVMAMIPQFSETEIGAPVPEQEGCIPHFAVYVDDVDQAAADLRAAGIETFRTPAKRVMPNTFGGLENWFFTGPSGEQIELLRML